MLPAAEPLAPVASIALPDASGAIPLTTDGKDVWIGVDGAVIRVDGVTGASTRFSVPAMRTGNGTLAIAADGLWLADHDGGSIERLDPSTGKVELTASAPGPNGFLFIGDRMWVASEPDDGVYPVDRLTGTLGTKIGSTFQVVAALGAIWEGEPKAADPKTVTRLDPTTGNVTATIAVPPGSGCSVGGSFPDEAWATCSMFQHPVGRDGVPVARIDPATGSVAAVGMLPSVGAGGVVVADGVPWALVPHGASDRTVTAELVALDPASGRATAVRSLGALDADTPVVTKTALWIPDEQGHRVLEFSLASLRP